jgi:hypothetical protein
MKTTLQKLIEQLDQKIELVNRCLETQDEVGVFMYTGLLAGFMESKVMAEKLLEDEKEKLCYFYVKGAEAELNNPYITNIEFYKKTFK